MQSPGAVDSTKVNSSNGTNSDISSRIPGRQSSVSKPRKKNNLTKNASAPAVDRKSTVLVRKKLPWLDGQKIPGQSESTESLGTVQPNEEPSPPPAPEKDPPARSRPQLVSSLSEDPALRAIGSTPSLRNGPRRGEFRSMSLNSQHRPSIKPVASKDDAKRTLGMFDETPRAAPYASSLYSASPSQSDLGASPRTLPKQDASSYDRLLDPRASMAAQPSYSPPQVPDQWLQSQVDFNTHVPFTPRNSIDPSWHPNEPPVSPRSKPKAPREKPRLDSCKSCGASPQMRPQIPRMPKAKTLPPPPLTALPPDAVPVEPAPQAVKRTPTLFAMPEHLLPSSSSSSHARLRKAPVQPVPAPQRWPSPVPMPQAAARKESGSLNRAVTGLENLMEEALTVARNAAQSGRNDEVANILDNATIALRKASTVQGRMNTGRMSQPLTVSPSISEYSSSSESSIEPHSDVSSTRSRGHSVDTAPTMYTKSAQPSQQPILVDQRKSSGWFPGSTKPAVDPFDDPASSPTRHSISRTPPRLYQPPSADSIVRDFAYARAKTAKPVTSRKFSRSYGSAVDYYQDKGQSVDAQPGVRPSLSAPMMTDKPLPSLPDTRKPSWKGPPYNIDIPNERRQLKPISRASQTPTQTIPPRTSSRAWETSPQTDTLARHRKPQQARPHLSDIFESNYYRHSTKLPDRDIAQPSEKQRNASMVTDTRYDETHASQLDSISKSTTRYSGPTNTFLTRDISLRHPRRNHISLREGQGFSLGRFHRRQPIAREWSTLRKRITATIACLNTVFVGLIAGIYAGEVPKIQYQLADTTHKVILGNVVLFACLGATTLIFWPLPLLHGRKPYTLVSFALMLPLMFPQALVVSGYRSPHNPIYRTGLLVPRAFQGIAMGFANINFLPTLFDLFGASLMSLKPHQEIVVYDDVRRQGGGVGIWLGIWSFCFVGSMSIGFCVGACIISALSPSWGFYLIVILLAFFMLVNVIAPETRRAPYRRSIAQFLDGEDGEEKIKRRVARGEIKLHISNDGPKWWWEEVGAGLILSKRMVFQPGFLILMHYLGWMYAQVTLVILFLGALLSRDYQWQPQYVGPAVLSVAVGALLALPLSRANLFSRARDTPARTDSMTMKHTRIHWSSHMLRRCIFTLTLPFAAIAYTLSSPGPSVSWTTPTVFCGLVGFLSNLAIAECVGLIMETFDTCDLQPGVNQKHRLLSMAETTRRRRTNYSSFPRICAGFFASQSLGFFLSAAATGVSGDITRAVGAQTATAIVAGILLVLTVLFIIVLWRWKEVQVIPNSVFGGKAWNGSVDWPPNAEDEEWRPVVIGNPSGKMRRVSLLELGSLSRWSEIRKLNKLMKD